MEWAPHEAFLLYAMYMLVGAMVTVVASKATVNTGVRCRPCHRDKWRDVNGKGRDGQEVIIIDRAGTQQIFAPWGKGSIFQCYHVIVYACLYQCCNHVTIRLFFFFVCIVYQGTSGPWSLSLER